MVNFELLKSGLRYLSEIFTICLSHVCANLMKKFLPLLNQPACNGPFLPKFWTALATVIVGIFFRKKFWWGFRPISVAYQKEFWISWKKRRFQIFQKPISPCFQSFLNKHAAQIIVFMKNAACTVLLHPAQTIVFLKKCILHIYYMLHKLFIFQVKIVNLQKICYFPTN